MILIKEDFNQILSALESAYNHLNYCGWGDTWERECAKDSKLPEQIEKALDIGRSVINGSNW